MSTPLRGPVGEPEAAGAAPLSADETTQLTARIDRTPTSRFHFRVAGLVGAGTFFDGFDAISLAVVLPMVVATFHIDFSTAGHMISAGYAGQFLGALLIGALSDRIGRKKSFVLCLLIFGALAIPCALAGSNSSLELFRFLQGLGLGAAVPIAATLVNEFLGRGNRGRFSVAYQTLFPLGLFFAPLIALILSERTSPENTWRILLMVGAVPILVALVAVFALPESPRWLAERGRLAEARALVERVEASAMRSGRPLPPVEKLPTPQAAARTRLTDMFAPPYTTRTLLLCILWFCTYFVTYGFSVWLPTLYVSIGGLQPTNSLKLTVALGAVQVAMAVVAIGTVERMSRRSVFTTGYVIAALGALFGYVNIKLLDQTQWQVLFIVGVLMTIGIMLPTMTLYLYTSELYPTRMRGFASSSASSLGRVASIVSPSVFGFLLDGHGGAGIVFAILALAAIIGLATMLIGGVETRNRSLEELSV